MYKPINDFRNSDADSPSISVRDTDEIKPQYKLEIHPENMNFGDIPVGTDSLPYTILLVNKGYEDIHILGHEIVGDYTILGDVPNFIAPNAIVSVQVVFTPQRPDTITGGLYLNTGNAQGSEFISATGRGITGEGEVDPFGTAATKDVEFFALAAQGALADTAVQPGDLHAVATSGSYADLLNKPFIPENVKVRSVAWAITSFHPEFAPEYIDTDGYNLPGDNGGFIARKRTPNTSPGHRAAFEITLSGGSKVWYAIEKEAIVTVQMFGATDTETTAYNSISINQALAWCADRLIRKLYIGHGLIKCDDDIVNEIGVYFQGPGVITVGSSGKPISFNELDLDRPVTGAQNLISWLSSISGSAIVYSNAALHGDSTTEGNPAWLSSPASNSHELLKSRALIEGFNANFYNYGVGGTGIASLDVSSWIYNTNYKLLILGYGINNASGGIKAYAAALRAKMTFIRSIRPFNLAIILKSPSAATDTYLANGNLNARDELFARQVHDVHVQVAREFNAVAVDVLSPIWSVRGSYGSALLDVLGLIDPAFRMDAHIHPKDVYNAHIWGNIIGSVVFSPAAGLYGKSNRAAYYTTFDSYLPVFTNVPNDYPRGKEVFSAATARSWPLNGDVYSDKSELTSYQLIVGSNKALLRIGNLSLNTFSNLTQLCNINDGVPTSFSTYITVNNSKISNVNGVGGHDGLFSFAVGTTPRLTVICNIPVGYRTRANKMGVLSVGGMGNYAIRISTNGDVILEEDITVSVATYGGIVSTWFILTPS